MAENDLSGETAQEVQQYFASIYANIDEGDLIIWDMFERDQKNYLFDKIKLLIPDAKSDILENIDDAIEESEQEKQQKCNKEIARLECENNKLAKIREEIVNQLWEQRLYSGGNLLMSIIYVLCTKEVEPEKAKFEKTYSITPVFRVRKCQSASSSKNCCMIFVDDSGRVYDNWLDYKVNNTLQAGIAVAPKDGVYSFDVRDNVKLDCFETPASTIAAKVVNTVDTGAGILGLGAAAVTVATMLTPIGAPVLLGASLIGGSTSLWSVGRSISKLVDRGTHKQSINITDRDARGSWISIAGGVIGAASSGVTQGFSKYVSSGRQVSKITQGVVNGLNIAAIATNGFGAGNGVLEIILKYRDGDDISAMDVADLGISLFLVTHSVYNFQTASKIIKASENSIDAFKKTLSKRMRKRFNKLVRETGNVNTARAKIDVIRGLDTSNNSTFGSNIVRTAGAVIIPPLTVAALSKAQEFVDIFLSEEKVMDWESLKRIVANILCTIPSTILEALLQIVKEFVSNFEENIEAVLQRIVPFEHFLFVAFRVFIKNNPLVQRVRENILNLNAGDIITGMLDYFSSINVNQGERKLCSVCSGWYYQVTNI